MSLGSDQTKLAVKTISDQDIKFLLKDARADRPTLIYLVLRYDNGRFKTSTGLTIDHYQWDSTTQRAHTNRKSRGIRETYQTINGNLDRYRAALKTILSRLQMANVPFSNDLIKQQLD